MKVVVLLENCKEQNNLKSDHGLSFYIETNDKKLILDFGSNEKFITNANLLDIDVTKIDYGFISHQHVDHAGGLNYFFNINKETKVFTIKKIESNYFAKIFGFFKVNVSSKLKEKYLNRITVTKELNVTEGIYFLPIMKKPSMNNPINNSLYEKIDAEYIHDHFEHEGILVIDEDEKLSIFNSCSHSGVKETINTVQELFPNKVILNYFGGMHLQNPISKENTSKKYLDSVQECLENSKINFFTGHCTGKCNYDYLKSSIGERLKYIKTGSIIEI